MIYYFSFEMLNLLPRMKTALEWYVIYTQPSTILSVEFPSEPMKHCQNGRIFLIKSTEIAHIIEALEDIRRKKAKKKLICKN